MDRDHLVKELQRHGADVSRLGRSVQMLRSALIDLETDLGLLLAPPGWAEARRRRKVEVSVRPAVEVPAPAAEDSQAEPAVEAGARPETPSEGWDGGEGGGVGGGGDGDEERMSEGWMDEEGESGGAEAGAGAGLRQGDEGGLEVDGDNVGFVDDE